MGSPRRARTVSRQFERSRYCFEALQPVRLVFRETRAALLIYLPALEARHLHRLGKAVGTACAARGVYQAEFAQDDVEAPPVADDVMSTEDQRVTFAGEFNDARRDEWAALEVESPQAFCFLQRQQAPLALRGWPRREVFKGDVDEQLRRNHLRVAIGAKRGAQGLVPIDHCLDRTAHRVDLKSTVQLHRARFIEGRAGQRPALTRQPDFALRLGDGDRAEAQRGLSVRPGERPTPARGPRVVRRAFPGAPRALRAYSDHRKGRAT